jgi:hypothetical protein
MGLETRPGPTCDSYRYPTEIEQCCADRVQLATNGQSRDPVAIDAGGRRSCSRIFDRQAPITICIAAEPNRFAKLNVLRILPDLRLRLGGRCRHCFPLGMADAPWARVELRWVFLTVGGVLLLGAIIYRIIFH